MVKKFFAELIGTAVLVLMGCGSAVLLGCVPSGGHLAVALAFGLSIVAMAYVIGNVSGCHINPAVSLAVLLNKGISIKEFFVYIIAQFIGGFAGAGILKYIVSTGVIDQTGALGSNVFNADTLGMAGAIVVEIVLTFIFVFTILGVTSDEKKSSVAGIVIGLTLTFVHIVGIPLTGTSVNPARSLAPAVFAGGVPLEQVWVFIVAPLVGSVLAYIVFRFVAKLKKA